MHKAIFGLFMAVAAMALILAPTTASAWSAGKGNQYCSVNGAKIPKAECDALKSKAQAPDKKAGKHKN